MKYQNYIFDLYGTLVDIETNENKFYLFDKLNQIYDSYGAHYKDAKAFKKRYLELIKLERAKSENPYYEHDIANVFLALFTEKGVSPKEDLISFIAKTFRILSRTKLQVYAGVFDFFDKIHEKGGKVYLLSNAQALFTEQELNTTHLIDYFDGVIISSHVGVCKPDCKIMDHLINQYQIDPKKSIMIGNDKRSDMKIAADYPMDSLYLITNETIHKASQKKEFDYIKPTYTVEGANYKKVMKLLLN